MKRTYLTYHSTLNPARVVRKEILEASYLRSDDIIVEVASPARVRMNLHFDRINKRVWYCRAGFPISPTSPHRVNVGIHGSIETVEEESSALEVA